jgi:hypothetical protein
MPLQMIPVHLLRPRDVLMMPVLARSRMRFSPVLPRGTPTTSLATVGLYARPVHLVLLVHLVNLVLRGAGLTPTYSSDLEFHPSVLLRLLAEERTLTFIHSVGQVRAPKSAR